MRVILHMLRKTVHFFGWVVYVVTSFPWSLTCIENLFPLHEGTRRYVEENGSAATLTAKRSAGVTPEVTLKERVKGMPLRLLTMALRPIGELPEVQNGCISGPTEKTYVLQKIKRKDRCGLLEMHPSFKLTVGNMGVMIFLQDRQLSFFEFYIIYRIYRRLFLLIFIFKITKNSIWQNLRNL